MRFSPETTAALEAGRDQVVDAYHDDPNVVGVGLGVRRRAGRWTGEPVVTVLVSKKRPEALVSRRRLLPGSVEVEGRSWGIDVIETGPPPTLSAPTRAALRGRPPRALQQELPIAERMRPPRPGCSISNVLAGPNLGTYGCNVRDRADGRICVLSCNHILARNNQGDRGEDIIQPGHPDGPIDPVANAIAILTRFDPIDPVDGTDTDAAIARLDHQEPGTGWTELMARDLMAPISPEHPAVGMVVGANVLGNSYLTVMDTVLDRLDVDLVAARDGSTATKQPEVGMHLEKVGRTSGYTSSQVVTFGMRVTFHLPAPLGDVPFRDLIYVPGFSEGGDSGAIACEGGNGEEYTDPDIRLPCPVLNSLGTYYQLPLTGDNALADQLRDEFMAQSLVGHLLLQATYVNAPVVHSRLEGRQAGDLELAYAHDYYLRYRDFVASVLADPSSSAVVTQEHLDDAAFITYGLAQTVLTAEEANAAFTLHEEVLADTLGMNRRQLIEYMNDAAVARRVHEVLSAVPTIELHEPITP